MKIKLYLILLVGLLTVGCQDSVMDDFEQAVVPISRSIGSNDANGTVDTKVSNKHKYTVTIRNEYDSTPLTMIAAHWEVCDRNFQYITGLEMVNEFSTIIVGNEMVGYFYAEPGEYVVTAVAENIGHVEVDCEIEAKNGGEIYFTLVNGIYPSAKWETPVFRSF